MLHYVRFTTWLQFFLFYCHTFIEATFYGYESLPRFETTSRIPQATLQGVQASFMLVLFLGEKTFILMKDRSYWGRTICLSDDVMMALDVRNFLCVKEEKLVSSHPTRRSCTKIELDKSKKSTSNSNSKRKKKQWQTRRTEVTCVSEGFWKHGPKSKIRLKWPKLFVQVIQKLI